MFKRLCIVCLLMLFLAGCSSLAMQLPRGFIPYTNRSTPTLADPVAVTPTSTAEPHNIILPTPTLEISVCVVANTGGLALNVRREPSLEAEIIDGLAPGERVTVLTQEGEWLLVDAAGVNGWVYGGYCERETK